MKVLKMIGLMAMLCFIMPAFVSCDKDDNDEIIVDPNNVIGTWVGSLEAKVVTAMGPVDCEMTGMYEVSIQKEPKDNDEVQVVIPETSFKYPGSDRVSTIPSFTIPDVNVKKTDKGYTISKDRYLETINGVEYSGSLKGTIIGAVAEISFTVKPGAMPMDISYTFKGMTLSSSYSILK